MAEFLVSARSLVEDLESTTATLAKLLAADLDVPPLRSAELLCRLGRIVAELEEVMNEWADAAPAPAVGQQP
jgi:hypothetical protein